MVHFSSANKFFSRHYV